MRRHLPDAQEIYKQGLALTSKQHPRWSIQEEPQIFSSALNVVEEIKRIFIFYRFDWMAQTLEKYSVELVWEFYANYLAMMEQKAKPREKLKEWPKLKISWPQFRAPDSTVEFDY
ncbi:hypothetical protein HAX54_037715 [Datura stramonium]|uniref:Uncharacterized protein n=1 Tax=Datura stramonium TaxID=4076 RepID=A0ABS8VK63_DATST|nr:hypothetical protein [Datura stramonium]